MNIKKIIVHVSESPDGREDTAEDIHRWHLERGWDGIGYHKVICRDGSVMNGRPEFWIGAHASGHNDDSLAVCLIGTEGFTQEQMHSLLNVILGWQEKYPEAEVIGHCDVDSSKTCPNFDVKQWFVDVRCALNLVGF